MRHKVIVLDEDYAAKMTPNGLEIFPYICQGDGELQRDPYSGYVVLSEKAQRELADMICSELGGCDLLKGAQRSDATGTVFFQTAPTGRSPGNKVI